MNSIQHLASAIASLKTYSKSLSSLALKLHHLGWAPKNSGNFSIRINDLLLTKVSGASMAQLARNPLPYLCFVRPSQTRLGFKVIPEDAVPTKEIMAHIFAQKIIARIRPYERAVLHTHPTETIKVTLIHPEKETLISGFLARVRSKIKTFRATPINYFPPGSKQLARATAQAFQNAHVIIWPRHGIIASGKTLGIAFHRIKVVNDLFKTVLTDEK